MLRREQSTHCLLLIQNKIFTIQRPLRPKDCRQPKVYPDTQNQEPNTQSLEMFTMNIVFAIYMYVERQNVGSAGSGRSTWK